MHKDIQILSLMIGHHCHFTALQHRHSRLLTTCVHSWRSATVP